MGTSWDTLNEIGENRDKEQKIMDGYSEEFTNLVAEAERRGEITTDQRMEFFTDITVMEGEAKDQGAEKTRTKILAHIEKVIEKAKGLKITHLKPEEIEAIKRTQDALWTEVEDNIKVSGRAVVDIGGRKVELVCCRPQRPEESDGGWKSGSHGYMLMKEGDGEMTVFDANNGDSFWPVIDHLVLGTASDRDTVFNDIKKQIEPFTNLEEAERAAKKAEKSPGQW